MEYNLTTDRYTSINKGRKHTYDRKGYIVVIDASGNVLSTQITDPRYMSGELKSVNTGKVNVVIEGKPTKVSKELFDTGNYVSINKGKIDVVDANGKSLKVFRDDARVVSGELKPRPRSDKGKAASSKDMTDYNLSCAGSKWMTSTEGKSKMIRPDDIDTKLSEGWTMGRTFSKPRKKVDNGRTGSKWMTPPDNGKSVMIPRDDIEFHLNMGWLFGRKM